MFPFLWFFATPAQRVEYYLTQVDAQSFMAWRDHGIAGVANIAGV
jgi:hypothetical protein